MARIHSSVIISSQKIRGLKRIARHFLSIYIYIHGHGDHYGDAERIAKANDAIIIGTAEIAGKAASMGCKTHAMHIGGTVALPFGSCI